MIQRDVIAATEKRNIMMLRNVGRGGVEWMQAAQSLADMEYSEGRVFTKEEIYAIFAPGLSSMLDVNSTEANSKAGKQTFLEFCIWPMLTATAEKITNDLLPTYGENLVAEFDDPRQVDRALELTEQQTYSLTHTVDEIRAEFYGDDPIGDERGEMLPVQINASTPIGDEPEPEPIPAQLQPFAEQQPAPEMRDEPAEQADPDNPEQASDMAKWLRKSLKALARGQSPVVSFESATIPVERAAWIGEALKYATSEDGVRAAFAGSKTIQAVTSAGLAAELKRANDLLEAVTVG
jgi:hypothetical protein